MKTLKSMMMGLVILGLVFSLAYAAGNADEGQKLFDDPNLSGSTNDKACSTCHPDGKGLAGVTEKQNFSTPAGKSDQLTTAINQCITMALQGNALPPDSQKMQDIIAYLKTIQESGS